MKAVVIRRYGAPEALAVGEVGDPAPAAGQVVVRVLASSVNPVDWHRIRGRPLLLRVSEGVRRPKEGQVGADLAGIVEAVSPDVSRWKAGDEVFGFGSGAFAERVAVSAAGVARKPAGVGFAAAGVVGVAATTALQGLRDHGGLSAGQRVLVAGAGGGVGTFAVQVAKAFGADVVASTSADKVDLVRSLGADEVIDYARTDATAERHRFDLILDAGGWLSLGGLARALRPGGTAVRSGAGGTVSFASIAAGMVGAAVLTKLGSRRFVSFLAQRSQADLEQLAAMLDDGRIRPVIDRTYPLDRIAEAVRYQEAGHAAGKVAISIGR